jgi:putative colanic acid biosynthesis acetyltransferase WcaF
LFGASIGRDVVIHSEVVVKYPWHLQVGNNCWIGERVWIDNLTSVTLGSDVCLSQGAYICTGNHDWCDSTFGLIVCPVEIQRGAWAGAKSVLLPGVTLAEGAVASAGSVVARTIPAWEIHGGNPASFLRAREIRNSYPLHEEFEEAAK